MAAKTKMYGFLEIEESHYTAGVASFSFAVQYRLFALMAGVRNEGGIVPVAPVRGFPSEPSKGAEFYFENLEKEFGSIHTKTYLTADEVQAAQNQLDTFNPGLVAANAAMQALVKKGSNPRLLIAFVG